eukprot:GHVN01074241.1.p1 GENE.GHVN01074241.1~~GHVN01074241.1.p1  ORF type:complete len:170 (+),score=27.49 GHVN01074241.1:16-525(+)
MEIDLELAVIETEETQPQKTPIESIIKEQCDLKGQPSAVSWGPCFFIGPEGDAPVPQEASCVPSPDQTSHATQSKPPIKRPTKRADKASSGAAPKKPKKQSVGEEEGESMILDYMLTQNRPYSVQNVFDNLHGRVAKPSVLRIMDALVERGKLIIKEYGQVPQGGSRQF